MKLGRYVKYWGRNAVVWTGISLACMLGFGGFGMLFGAIALRWGKIGSIIMAAAIMVMTVSIAVFIAMQGGSISLQHISLEAVTELNFWPLALAMAVFYLLTGAAAFMLTRKIEVRV